MATVAAIAEMKKTAHNRLDAAAAKLAKRFDLTPVEPRLARDRDFKEIYQLQDMATLLEGLVEVTKPVEKTVALDAKGGKGK